MTKSRTQRRWVLNEALGVLCTKVRESVMGEAVHTPILRYKVKYPLVMKYGLWRIP